MLPDNWPLWLILFGALFFLLWRFVDWRVRRVSTQIMRDVHDVDRYQRQAAELRRQRQTRNGKDA